MTSTYPTTADSFVRPSVADGLRTLSDLVTENSLDDAFDALEALETRAGTVAGTSIATTAVTEVMGARTAIITGTAVPITVANTTGVSFGGTKIFTFPQGIIRILGAVMSTGVTLTFPGTGGNETPLLGTYGGDFSVGSTVAGDGTLTGTDVDIIPSTSQDPLSTPVGAFLAADIAAPFDGHTTATALYLNYLIDDADVGNTANDDMLATFVLKVTYVNLGDY